jgi:hypothetical protein
MSGSSYWRVTKAIAVAALLAIVSAMPAAAAAKSKKSSSLTKAQVIKLIKQYSKPGPQGKQGAQGAQGTQGTQGAKGDAGPAGSYTIAGGSGLKLSGSALSVNIGDCPDYDFADGFTTALGCKPEPTSDYQSGFGGYGAGSLFGEFPPVGLTITNTYSEIAHATVGVTGGHIINAAVQLASSAVDADTCQLRQNTTDLQTEQTVIPVDAGSGYTTMYLEYGVGLNAGDTVSVWCRTQNSGQSDDAGGNVVTYLANNP